MTEKTRYSIQFDKVVEALRDYHDLVLDKFPEFDGNSCDSEQLCIRCQTSGCITQKIINARDILAALEKEISNGNE